MSELLALRVGDVWQHGGFGERVASARTHMKGKHEGRSIPLHHEAKSALAAWLVEMNRQGDMSQDTSLFASRKGFNHPLRPGQASPAASLRRMPSHGELSSHTMRKTCGQTVYEKSGRDLLKTQRTMGHKSLASTVAYLHIDERDIDALMLAL